MEREGNHDKRTARRGVPVILSLTSPVKVYIGLGVLIKQKTE